MKIARVPDDYILNVGDNPILDSGVNGHLMVEILKPEKSFLDYGVAKGYLARILKDGKQVIADKKYLFLPIEKLRGYKLEILLK